MVGPRVQVAELKNVLSEPNSSRTSVSLRRRSTIMNATTVSKTQVRAQNGRCPRLILVPLWPGLYLRRKRDGEDFPSYEENDRGVRGCRRVAEL
jgi:hypothetical protein